MINNQLIQLKNFYLEVKIKIKVKQIKDSKKMIKCKNNY